MAHTEDTPSVEEMVEEVLNGTWNTHTISHEGISQYRAGGVSACGLAALNFVRFAFEREQHPQSEQHLLYELVSEDALKEIMSICFHWSSQAHLEVDTDLYNVSLFQRALRGVDSTYDVPSFQNFQKLLLDLEKLSLTQSSAVVITRPPEIIACVKSPSPDGNMFIIFDSHPRPRYPQGLGIIITTSLDEAASQINDLLAVDQSILSDSSLQWQAQLLAHFSGHFYVPKPVPNCPSEIQRAIMESSVAVLNLRAEAADLRSQNSMLLSTQTFLEEQIEELQDQVRTQSRELSDLKASKVSQPSLPAAPLPILSSLKGKEREIAIPSTFQLSPYSARPVFLTDDERDMGSLHLALQMQDQFNSEHDTLTQQREAPASYSQEVFECGICFDTFPLVDVAKLEPCGHSFCRGCIKQYAQTKLGEHRFPIFCPLCVTQASREEHSELLGDFLQTLGLENDEYQLFEEFQLSKLSILIHCRKCQQGMFVDRQEHEEAKIVPCPLPTCNFAWCKACLQPIDFSGPPHSCDGASELAHLMKQQGWKSCPGCRTHVQKESGCNHMTCAAPGCNTHFCYVCGEQIVKSVRRNEVSTAVSSHYRRCQLFVIPRGLR